MAVFIQRQAFRLHDYVLVISSSYFFKNKLLWPNATVGHNATDILLPCGCEQILNYKSRN